MKRLSPLVAANVVNVALIAGFARMTHTPPGGPARKPLSAVCALGGKPPAPSAVVRAPP